MQQKTTKTGNLFTQPLTLLLIALFLAFSGPAGAEENGKLISTIQQRGVLRVGMDLFQPWAMKRPDGELIGYEIDVARKLAKDLGVKIEFMPTAWDGIIPALLTKRFDMIIGGMGITKERQRRVDFTIPYEYAGQSIVANRKRSGHRTTLDAYNDPGVEIAVKIGTTAAKAAKSRFPKATLRLFDTEPATFQELRNGGVDAAVSSAPKPAFEALDYSDILFQPTTETFAREPDGIALRKGDKASVDYLNRWITENKEWLETRHRYWFESREWMQQLK